MTTEYEMSVQEAIDIVTEAVGAIDDFAVITTSPTPRQRAALDRLRFEDIAPKSVCDDVDLPQGSTWGEVRAAILEGVQDAT